MKRAFDLLLAFLLLGCGTPGGKPVVFGLYDVPVESLQEVKQAGFDVVTPHPTKPGVEFLHAAAEAKLGVLVHSSAFSGDPSRVKHEIATFDRHPATWGWYLIDEPDLHNVPPPRVAQVTRAFQQRTQKPGVVVLSSGNAATSFGKDCDLLMVDFYPVPWAPIARFGKEMRLASFARGKEPYFAVVQAFDWTHFSDVLGQTNDLRAPTISEIRCMAYMALALEAKGLFFYTFQARNWHLAESPLWPELKNLVHELRKVSALFAKQPLWWPSEIEYGDPERMYNEVHDGVILLRLYHVASVREGMPAGYYFVAINTTGQPVEFDFLLPFPGVEAVARGGERIPVEDGWLRRSYAPYEVAVFGPITHQVLNPEVRDGIFRQERGSN